MRRRAKYPLSGIHLRSGIKTSDFKQQVKVLYGDRLTALDREEQHPDLSYLIRMEKVMTYLILLFILLLAASTSPARLLCSSSRSKTTAVSSPLSVHHPASHNRSSVVWAY